MLEIKGLLEEQFEAFSEFKDKNDNRLDVLEKALMIQNRPSNPGATGPKTKEQAAYSKAFESFVKTGDVVDLNQATKALNITTPADGGYAVPSVIDDKVLDLLEAASPMRSICNIVKVGTSDYKKLVNLHGTASGWVDEDEARPETDAPSLAQLTPYMGEIYANPAATQTMIDDSFFNAEDWLVEECSTAFQKEEGSVFLSGTGTKQAKGFLSYTTAATADASRTFGVLEHMAAASATVITSDELITFLYKLAASLRKEACWLMNSLTASYIRKLKDGQENYLWKADYAAGQPETLLGYRVMIDENMPDVSAGAIPIAFGNFKRGYTIVDRMGVRTLRDPYTNKPYVHFYCTKRVGGMVVDSNAIKLLKMASE